jgi:hypothetical protein
MLNHAAQPTVARGCKLHVRCMLDGYCSLHEYHALVVHVIHAAAQEALQAADCCCCGPPASVSLWSVVVVALSWHMPFGHLSGLLGWQPLLTLCAGKGPNDSRGSLARYGFPKGLLL